MLGHETLCVFSGFLSFNSSGPRRNIHGIRGLMYPNPSCSGSCNGASAFGDVERGDVFRRGGQRAVCRRCLRWYRVPERSVNDLAAAVLPPHNLVKLKRLSDSVQSAVMRCDSATAVSWLDITVCSIWLGEKGPLGKHFVFKAGYFSCEE